MTGNREKAAEYANKVLELENAMTRDPNITPEDIAKLQKKAASYKSKKESFERKAVRKRRSGRSVALEKEQKVRNVQEDAQEKEWAAKMEEEAKEFEQAFESFLDHIFHPDHEDEKAAEEKHNFIEQLDKFFERAIDNFAKDHNYDELEMDSKSPFTLTPKPDHDYEIHDKNNPDSSIFVSTTKDGISIDLEKFREQEKDTPSKGLFTFVVEDEKGKTATVTLTGDGEVVGLKPENIQSEAGFAYPVIDITDGKTTKHHCTATQELQNDIKDLAIPKGRVQDLIKHFEGKIQNSDLNHISSPNSTPSTGKGQPPQTRSH